MSTDVTGREPSYNYGMKRFVCIENDNSDVGVELTFATSPEELLVKLSKKYFEQFDSKEQFTDWFIKSCESLSCMYGTVSFEEHEV
tara:strand:+ start:17774 stop:18031 length:258 start_codon:yes stop_codon:yes gene_type:complete